MRVAPRSKRSGITLWVSMSTQVGREVRTSLTHPIQVNWLPPEVADRVGLTFAPGKKGRSLQGFNWDRDLAMDLDVLAHEHRVDVLVCLMETAELADKGLPDLPAQAQQRGIALVHFPIKDVDAPRDPGAVDVLLDGIEARLASGARVVLHCLGGIGRTGTIATCLLVRRGMPLAKAMQIVQQTRCKAFPEGSAQGPFVSAYERHVRERHPSPLAVATPVTATDPRPSSTHTRATAPALPWLVLGAGQPAALERSAARSKSQVCDLLAAVEQQVKAAPSACFTLGGDGAATLHVKGAAYHAGRFEVPTIATLEQRIRQARPTKSAPGRIRLSILRGTGPETDIGALQAVAPAGTLFQVASQFNCLEAMGAQLAAIREYPHDATQGPRASVSAFPGTFLRHYFAPRASGERYVQTSKDGINLLADALEPRLATVNSGYLTSDLIGDPAGLASALEHKFDQLRVGLHDEVEVVLGANWGGPVPNAPHQRIAQAFTSTIALGGYSRDDGSPALALVRQQLLRAAYLGTLLGAVALGKHTVVLTLIGGGAFANPPRAIWDAIHWAVARAEPLAGGTLDVVVNARGPASDADVARARASGGSYV